MRVAAEGLRHELFELGLDLVDRFSRRKASPIADSKDMRVDRECLFAKRRVEHDVRSLPPDPGKRLKCLAGARHFTVMLLNQCVAERNDIPRFGIEQANGLDRLA
jgi:hypothetical protein